MGASSSVLGWILAFCGLSAGLLLLALRQRRTAAATGLRWGRHILAAQEEERQRIARVLHGDVLQQLFLARLALDQDDPAAVAEGIDAASASLRRLVARLYPPALQQLPLEKALAELVLTRHTDGPPTITLTTSGEAASSGDRRVALYRVAQEALANATRHAQATTVRVHLGAQDGVITLSITDDGVGGAGTAVRASSGGLRTMSERMKSVGGRLEITSKRGRGTTVLAKVPTE